MKETLVGKSFSKIIKQNPRKAEKKKSSHYPSGSLESESFEGAGERTKRVLRQTETGNEG